MAALICPPLLTAPEKRERGCCTACFAEKKSWTKCWITVSSSNSSDFFGIEDPDWGAISPELSPVSEFNCCFYEKVLCVVLGSRVFRTRCHMINIKFYTG